jgi:hypothetical protein
VRQAALRGDVPAVCPEKALASARRGATVHELRCRTGTGGAALSAASRRTFGKESGFNPRVVGALYLGGERDRSSEAPVSTRIGL